MENRFLIKIAFFSVEHAFIDLYYLAHIGEYSNINHKNVKIVSND